MLTCGRGRASDMAAAAPEPITEPKKRGIDYSKFENIEDSDDEKVQTSPKSATASSSEQPHCHNCHKEVLKALRCGVCKKVSYCTPQCQKDDWPYHKRTCKKPAEVKTPAVEKPPAHFKEPQRKQRVEEKVVESEETLNWYRHREWKPTEEPKREFSPTLLAGKDAEAASMTKKPSAGSAWNAAGTWEDKDVTSMARQTLQVKLEGLPDIEAASGTISVTEVSDIEGDASKPVIRGKMRHIFDLSFKLKFTFKWMSSGGQQNLEGHIHVHDFTNDTFNEGVLLAPVVQLVFKDASSLDPARRQAVVAALGAAWPPAGGLLGSAAVRMKEWAYEYELRE